MATYTIDQLNQLASKIKSKSTAVNKAASLSINKAATVTVSKSIELITNEVNLNPTYIKQHLKTVARASPANLRAKIQANARGTHLNRYPNIKTKDGMRVAVDKGHGFREIKNAFRVTGLKGSNSSGIALRNRDAVGFFQANIAKTGRTPAKSRKLQRIIAKARTKPNGIEVLHSRSINQLFLTVSENVKPYSNEFLVSEFLSQFERLNK
ncbi:Minor tail protein [Shewanella sp. phage 1/44]|uniref:minor tail protein n=1 Tax=Shewanella sp. phage 1/44 TaxID=1458862 RepID=UPI0004F7E960|nr:minor tail protein [Shewanella sp. phage 1/44]AHK11746.1 Minor tail protein [Shewanella sp. phage 1/44]